MKGKDQRVIRVSGLTYVSPESLRGYSDRVASARIIVLGWLGGRMIRPSSIDVSRYNMR